MKSAQKKKASFTKVIFFKQLSILLDAASVFFGFYLAMRLCCSKEEAALFIQGHFWFLALLTVPLFFVFYLSDIYPRYRYFDNLVRVIPLWKAAAYTLILQLILTLDMQPHIAPSLVAVALFFEVWTITLCKLLITALARVAVPKDRALLIGYAPGDERYFHFLKIQRRLNLPIEIAGIIGTAHEHDKAVLGRYGFSYLGDIPN